MIISFLSDVNKVVPIEMALVVGCALFALSWVRPRRLVTDLHDGPRRRILIWVGALGSITVVAIASATSAIPVSIVGGTGFEGWWRRPAPLLAATLVLVVASIAMQRLPQPPRGEHAITPHRSWATFAPRPALGLGAAVALVIGATAGWQIAIAGPAPAEGPFFGYVPDYTPLPIYRSFNSGYGYVAGAGWPNHLATLITLAVAIAVLVLVLRHDANRAMPAQVMVPSTAPARQSTARLFTLLVVAGGITTLGALWLHVGSYGTTLVGLDERWVSAEQSFPQLTIDGEYSALARPMKMAGYVLQGAGVALALRLAVDTLRAAYSTRTTASLRVDSSIAAR
ncbi:hypothetical protein IFT77_06585 [Frigoribacterium sp. CFBP 13729]|uniref:hypothetical protein n=1 Tax=Frigoribacterium sp. CFBP 13729 TaxID=2775293 RepID=UPI0017850A91|nr:hypothetical protein [Frigoribacterium sp. CFBP 13729]MBD8610148.1 hypothetical protein [Frigoribacterium sp. CFBP 13729]